MGTVPFSPFGVTRDRSCRCGTGAFVAFMVLHRQLRKLIILNIKEGKILQYITNLDRKKLGLYGNELITEEVILTDERLYEHILLYHEDEYKQLRPYIKSIIENPDYIVEDNRHEDTMIYLKQIDDKTKNGRVVIKLALGQDEEHNKNSIITLMKLNKRTWNQTIRNRGKIIWKN